MSFKQVLKEDLARMKEFFPKLLVLNDDGKSPSFSGELDIFDGTGDYWDSFFIKLIMPASYPCCVPRLFETGGKIEAVADRHVNNDGSCCVSVEHVLLHRASRGLAATDYLLEYAWPYFANQLYFEKEGHYAAGEYAHGLAGIQQFYRETLNIPDHRLALLLLSAVVKRTLPGPNQPCFCGSGLKFKNCHRHAACYLERLPSARIAADIALYNAFPEGTKNEYL